jgi:type IV pilus assembly protein PilY1
MGYSYGNPVITKRASDGRWVVLVTSGYNNVSPGDGQGHLYVLDALTGTKLDDLKTNVCDNTTPVPSGLGKIAVWADNPSVDNTGQTVYGGDMLGNVWRFDLTKNPAAVLLLARTLDASGKPQPITTKPELALASDGLTAIVYVGTGRYLGNVDLTDPATQSPAPNPINAWQQSLYAFKDTNKSIGSLRSATGMVKQTLTAAANTRTISNVSVDLNSQAGWYIDFNLSDSPGERVTLDPQLALGTLNVTTNVPNSTACAVGGDSWSYQFNYLTGSYVATAPGSIVGYKQTGALAVGMVIYQLVKGSLIGQLQRSDTVKIQQNIYTAPGTAKHRRTSWRELTK